MLVENYTIIFMMHKQIKQHQRLIGKKKLLDFIRNLYSNILNPAVFMDLCRVTRDAGLHGEVDIAQGC